MFRQTTKRTLLRKFNRVFSVVYENPILNFSDNIKIEIEYDQDKNHIVLVFYTLNQSRFEYQYHFTLQEYSEKRSYDFRITRISENQFCVQQFLYAKNCSSHYQCTLWIFGKKSQEDRFNLIKDIKIPMIYKGSIPTSHWLPFRKPEEVRRDQFRVLQVTNDYVLCAQGLKYSYQVIQKISLSGKLLGELALIWRDTMYSICSDHVTVLPSGHLVLTVEKGLCSLPLRNPAILDPNRMTIELIPDIRSVDSRENFYGIEGTVIYAAHNHKIFVELPQLVNYCRPLVTSALGNAQMASIVLSYFSGPSQQGMFASSTKNNNPSENKERRAFRSC